MAFDGIFLHQVVGQLQSLAGLRINKVYQISDTEVLFNLHGRSTVQLMISCHSRYNRINITARQYPTRPDPSMFIMLLRKYLEGGTITSIVQAGLDRYLSISVATRNELGDRITIELYVELMGKYANLILVSQGRIIDALKRIPPFENTRRTIQPGAAFVVTDGQPDKIDPFTARSADLSQDLTAQFIGFSPLLANEITFRMKNGQSFAGIMAAIAQSDKVYISTVKDEDFFHCLPLTQFDAVPVEMDINEGLDHLYFVKEQRDRIRQQTGDLFKFTRKESKKLQNKLDKLQDSLNQANDCDKWRQYGDVLYANPGAATKGVSHILLTDYQQQTVDVPTDPKLDYRANAQKCYQRYRKGINGRKFIGEQIELASDELHYFQQLEDQLALADFNDAVEIRQELEANGYLHARQQRQRKKKATEPHFLTLDFQGLKVYVGKNNLQNEYLTFHKAGRNDTWFHVKDVHGSHVIMTTPSPDEAQIRFGAMLAAYWSRARQSSSIPVDYTLVRNLKKIPGSKAGKVIMKEYRTIYIDIDLNLLSQYLTIDVQ